MKKRFILTLFMFMPLVVFADNFQWKTKIDSVSFTGFYKIILTPEIVAALKTDYSDIRIFDSNNHEIPYLFQEEQPLRRHSGFKEYEIIENTHIQKPPITRVIIHNLAKKILFSFVIIVRNTDVEKEITLKGSDDRQNWFIIKQNYPVNSTNYDGSTSEIWVLDFPKSNYEYFELVLNDKRKDPIQILKVGYYESETESGTYSKVPPPDIIQKDSSQVKKSFINLKFDNAYELSRFELTIKGPEFYKRSCVLGRYVKSNNRMVFDVIDRFVLSSGDNPILDFGKFKTNDLVLIIENKDDQPLRIVSANAFQLNKYIVAYLKTNENYTLSFGNKETRRPEYDLKFFVDSIKNNIPLLGIGILIAAKPAKTHAISIIFNKTFLWISIILVILLLTWYSIRLLKEMSKST